MSRFVLVSCALLTASMCACSAHADCIAKGFTEQDFPHNPIYEVLACGPAEPIIETLRQANPDYFGEFTYSESDTVITVKAANDHARKLMWKDIEYWYFPAGCESVTAGMRIERPALRELCCDLLPVRSLPCGVGGKQLLKLE